MASLISELHLLSIGEIFALVLALVYIVLATKKSQWCWPAAFVSTALYTLIFWQVSLVSESILNAYYMTMAVVGWFSWHHQQTDDPDHQFKYSTRPISWHIKACLKLLLASGLWGIMAQNYLGADMAYIDAFTTVFAIFATWMLTQRLLENWIYWMIINPISAYLYLSKGLAITSLLMVVYSFMAAYGWYSWKQSPRESRVYQ